MMQGNGKETGGIRHKLGSLFSPRGPPQASRGREEVEHGTFITADVLRVRGHGLGVYIIDINLWVYAVVVVVFFFPGAGRCPYAAQSACHERAV